MRQIACLLTLRGGMDAPLRKRGRFTTAAGILKFHGHRADLIYELYPEVFLMLVTSRRQGEAMLIGEDIEVILVRVGRSKVQVGIRAPRKYRVVAGEKKTAPQVLPLRVEERK